MRGEQLAGGDVERAAAASKGRVCDVPGLEVARRPDDGLRALNAGG
jgi:hypothetical protein